jgi:hypothetical protein
MSVNGKPEPKPRWEYYELARQFEGDIRRMGRRYGADTIDADQIGTASAIQICFRPDIDTWDSAKRYFFKVCKFRFYGFKERAEVSASQMGVNMRLDGAAHAFDLLAGGSLPARQENQAYLQQVLREMRLLPTRVQRVMRLLMEGYSPLEIASQKEWDIKSVLADIRIARDWLESANELPTL